MNKQTFLPGLALVLFFGSTALGQAAAPAHGSDSSLLAATPPMGWNSWDGYGTTVKEADVKANAQWLAEHLKPFGWQYVVVDMEWFVTNPTPEGNSKTSQYSMDDFGRYTPAVNRFPSAANAAGFKPLADYVHSLGLKFGIHILQGIPKQAVEKNLPISGSPYRAADAADTSHTCSWNFDNYGLDASKPGAQAYYDSIAKLYASWDVDLIKVDCISSRPYKGDEIRMLSYGAGPDRPADCSESFARAGSAGKNGGDAEVCPDVANFKRYLGPVAQHCRLSPGPGRPVRKRGEMGGQGTAGALAGCGHASAGISGAGSRMGPAALHPAYARRAENVSYPVVHLCFTADGGRRPAQGRCLDDCVAHQSRGHRG